MPDDPNRPQEPLRDANGNPIPPPSFGSPPPPARPLPGNPPPPSFGGPAGQPGAQQYGQPSEQKYDLAGNPIPSAGGPPPGPPPAYGQPPPGGTPGVWPPPAGPYGQPPNPYGQPGYYPVEVKGGQILTMGILSFFCFGIILGTIAYTQGTKALAAIDQGQGDPSQRGQVSAGRICGLIGAILSVISIILNIGLAISGHSLLGGH